MNILGISAYYHDSAAALVRDGEIVAAAQEERFTREKHDASFPTQAISYCLKEGGLALKNVDRVVFYDKPDVKFKRLLKTYLAYAPRGLRSFMLSMPSWLKDKFYFERLLKQQLSALEQDNISVLPQLLFTDHHHAHAASAFYPSPFKKAAVLCLDGVGEWATTSVWVGDGNRLMPEWQINFPHSLGLLYAAFTSFTGFKINSGEYKVMGLAPYGEPKYVDLIFDRLIDVKEDGTFRLCMDYFNYPVGMTMTNKRFHALFGGPPRQPNAEITQREMDLASSIQVVIEEVVLRLARTIKRESGQDYLCLAGGVALNCVVNGRILHENLFKDIWIQPASGDAGGALGAALGVWHEYYNRPRIPHASDKMKGTYLGPSFTNEEICAELDAMGAVYQQLDDQRLLPKLAKLLANGNVCGWFQGKMEFGPRALGNRSILGDPRNPKMQSTINLKVKYRESFRPFAPSVLASHASDYFELDRPSPYMLLVVPLKKNQCLPLSKGQNSLVGLQKLGVPRSLVPAVTHIDCTARVQTVHKKINSRYYDLLNHFYSLTGCAVLVNTSFNTGEEPIVCTPQEAYHCFMNTEMDYLVIGNCLLSKTDQPHWGQYFTDKDMDADTN